MADFPRNFVADLRNLKNYPTMKDSPWRRPYLARLTYGQIHHLVDEYVVGGNLSVLDVGCGTGWLSLELAREGHKVVGVDSSSEIVQIAERTMEAGRYDEGRLTYRATDFSSLDDPKESYDLIIFSRVLHHMLGPDKALAKAGDLLRSGGQIICVEYAYDRFVETTAQWVHEMRRNLAKSGWYKSKKSAVNEQEAIEQIIEEYQGPAEKEHFNRASEMIEPLTTRFDQAHFSWEPYAYWDLIMDMRVPSEEAEMATAQAIMSMESALIERDAISPVLFCFVGSKT